MALNSVDLPTLGRPTIPALSMDLRYFTLARLKPSRYTTDFRITSREGFSRAAASADRIRQLVRMLAVGDDDVERARQPGQLAGARVRDHGHRQLLLAAHHHAVVLQHEGAVAPV